MKTASTPASTSQTIVTRVAKATHTAHQFCGFDLLGDLLGNETYMGLMGMAAGGKRLSPEERSTLDDFAVALTVADPRIWPLKIARLAASYGGALAGYAAGQLCTEGATIGGPVVGASSELLVAVSKLVSGLTDEEAITAAIRAYVVGAKRLAGYGVPFRETDERVVALQPLMEARGRTGMKFWKLQDRITAVVRAERNLGPNVGIVAAALLLDMDFTPRQAAIMTTFAYQNTFIANAVEGAAQAAESLRRLPNEAIDYVGRPPRESAPAMANRVRTQARGMRDTSVGAVVVS